MNVVIIEDEHLSAEHLMRLLERIDASIQVVQRFETVKQSLEAFKNGLCADLLFVDIHLADGNAFELFSSISIDIPVIFTTAFDQYAIQSFQTNSIDYLLKPIGIDELTVAINKFNRLSRQQHQQLVQNLINIRPQSTFKTRFMVKLGENIVSIKTDEVDHFKAEDGIVLLVNQFGKRYPVDYTMDQLEPLLDPAIFFRINRKAYVNIENVKKVGQFFNSRLKVSTNHLDGDDAVVSRERVGNFKEWLNR
jgi:DNA-binding LytR/AlgR family response regulator